MKLEQTASELAVTLAVEAAEQGLAPRGAPLPQLQTRIETLLRQASSGDRTEAEAALRWLARTLAQAGRPVSVLHQLAKALLAHGAVALDTPELLGLQPLVLWALEIGAAAYVEERARGDEARFRRLSDSGIIGVFVADLDGKVTEANDAFLGMLGLSREDLRAGAVNLMSITPPEWRGASEVAQRQLRATGVARPYEKEYLRKDGSRVPVVLGAAMLDGERGIGFAHDNTASKRLEELQREAVEMEAHSRRIEQTNRLKNEFLASMSHELRTPLNAIIGFAQLMGDGEAGALDPQQKEFVAAILSGGRSLLRLINDVLDLVRVEAGKLEFRPEPADLPAILREVAQIAQQSAEAKRIQLTTAVDPAVQKGIILDPARLKQILYGYVSNAVKFTPEGGSVTIRAAPEGAEELRIEVEDTGVGIAPDQLHRLFGEPYQVDSGSAKLHGGSGLGLVLTRRLVEAQGGRVEARSTPGKGSVFSAVLPRTSYATRPAPIQRRAPALAGTSVLVIEDDPEDQVMLVDALEGAGYAVQVAGRGADAMSLCRTNRFDAITLDLLLPDMSGIDLLAQIRKTGLNRDTPVLVVSVAADSAVGFAVSDVLPKPVAAQGLLASLRNAGVNPGNGDVMVVDDDPICLSLMTAALKQFGYHPACFQDGEEGLRAAELKPPSAVVLDLVMPGIDGFQFLERLRASPATRKTPVLVWTTKDLTAGELAQLKEAAQGVVPKGRRAGVASLLEDLRRFTAPANEIRQGS